MAEKKLSEELRHYLDGNGCQQCSNYQSESRLTCPSLLQKAYERIKKYEEMEEQKKFLKLPCAEGDSVYEVYYPQNEIVEKSVIGFSHDGMWIGNTFDWIPYTRIGDTIFLKKKEAEDALKAKNAKAIATAKKLVYWKAIRTIAGTEEDRVIKCSNCGHMINFYDLEQLRFEQPSNYKKTMEEKYYKCENCKEKMDIKLSYILRERSIFENDYYEDGYEKEIIRILMSDEYGI